MNMGVLLGGGALSTVWVKRIKIYDVSNTDFVSVFK
jgi:hypothetical protein